MRRVPSPHWRSAPVSRRWPSCSTRRTNLRFGSSISSPEDPRRSPSRTSCWTGQRRSRSRQMVNTLRSPEPTGSKRARRLCPGNGTATFRAGFPRLRAARLRVPARRDAALGCGRRAHFHRDARCSRLASGREPLARPPDSHARVPSGLASRRQPPADKHRPAPCALGNRVGMPIARCNPGGTGLRPVGIQPETGRGHRAQRPIGAGRVLGVFQCAAGQPIPGRLAYLPDTSLGEIVEGSPISVDFDICGPDYDPPLPDPAG